MCLVNFLMALSGLQTDRNLPKSEAAFINLSKKQQFQAAFHFSENGVTRCSTGSQGFCLPRQAVSGHLPACFKERNRTAEK